MPKPRAYKFRGHRHRFYVYPLVRVFPLNKLLYDSRYKLALCAKESSRISTESPLSTAYRKNLNPGTRSVAHLLSQVVGVNP